MAKFKKAKRGAPTKCTPELITEIANYLRAGAYVETASALAGIDRSTFKDWLGRGRKAPKSVYAEFSRTVRKAMAEAEMRDLLNIDKAAMGQKEEYMHYPQGARVETALGDLMDVSGQIVTDIKGKPILKQVGVAPDWSASAWRLERKFPKKWARTEKTIELPEIEDEETADTIEVHFIDEKKK